MGASASFTFDTSKFENPKIMEKKLHRAIFGVCRYWDGRVEASMKHNAPWTDRTTNARSGLAARAAKLGRSSFAIILSHAVNYGIYLETMQGGRFAIIEPTIKLFAPKVIKTLTKILDRLGS